MSEADPVISAGEAPLLAHRVRDAVFWRSGSQIVAQIVMWVSTVLVVRLLIPGDYGIFAMTQVVYALFMVLNGYSFASALIQDETLDRERVAQAFGLLILLNGGLALAQFTVAPLAAVYFRQPIVADMLRWQSLLFLATPIIALNTAILARGLDFRKQAVTNLAGAFAGAATALGCALSGLGVWTLVAAPIAMFFTRAIGLTVVAGLPPMPSFRFKGAAGMLSFGGALMISQVFWIIQSQSDIVIAGRALNVHDLGLYSEALFLTLIFTAKFIPPLNEVAFPAYTQLARAKGDVGGAFIMSARLTMLVALPLYAGMALVAGPLVATLFGPKWLQMVPIVAGIALAMPFYALQIICSPATNALGRPRIYVASNAAGAAIMPIAFLLGARFGVQGLVHAWQVAAPLLLAVTLALTLPAVGARARDLAAALLPAAGAAAIMALAVWLAGPLTSGLPAPAALAILVAVGGLVYTGLLWRFSPATIADLRRLIIHRKVAEVVA